MAYTTTSQTTETGTGGQQPISDERAEQPAGTGEAGISIVGGARPSRKALRVIGVSAPPEGGMVGKAKITVTPSTISGGVTVQPRQKAAEQEDVSFGAGVPQKYGGEMDIFETQPTFYFGPGKPSTEEEQANRNKAQKIYDTLQTAAGIDVSTDKGKQRFTDTVNKLPPSDTITGFLHDYLAPEFKDRASIALKDIADKIVKIYKDKKAIEKAHDLAFFDEKGNSIRYDLRTDKERKFDEQQAKEKAREEAAAEAKAKGERKADKNDSNKKLAEDKRDALRNRADERRELKDRERGDLNANENARERKLDRAKSDWKDDVGELKALDKKKDELERDLRDINSKLAGIKAKIPERNAIVEGGEKLVSDSQAITDKIVKDRDADIIDANSKIRQNMEEQQKIEDAIAGEDDETEVVIAKKKRTVEDWKAHLTNLDNDNADLDNKKRESDISKAKALQDQNKVVADVNRDRVALSELKGEMAELENKAGAIREDIAKLGDTGKAIRDRNARYRDDVDRIESKYDAKGEAIGRRANAELGANNLEDDKADAQGELEGAKFDREQLAKEIDEAKQKIAKYPDIEKTPAEVELESRVAKYDAELGKYKTYIENTAGKYVATGVTDAIENAEAKRKKISDEAGAAPITAATIPQHKEFGRQQQEISDDIRRLKDFDQKIKTLEQHRAIPEGKRKYLAGQRRPPEQIAIDEQIKDLERQMAQKDKDIQNANAKLQNIQQQQDKLKQPPAPAQVGQVEPKPIEPEKRVEPPMAVVPPELISAVIPEGVKPEVPLTGEADMFAMVEPSAPREAPTLPELTPDEKAKLSIEAQRVYDSRRKLEETAKTLLEFPYFEEAKTNAVAKKKLADVVDAANTAYDEYIKSAKAYNDKQQLGLLAGKIGVYPHFTKEMGITLKQAEPLTQLISFEILLVGYFPNVERDFRVNPKTGDIEMRYKGYPFIGSLTITEIQQYLQDEIVNVERERAKKAATEEERTRYDGIIGKGKALLTVIGSLASIPIIKETLGVLTIPGNVLDRIAGEVALLGIPEKDRERLIREGRGVSDLLRAEGREYDVGTLNILALAASMSFDFMALGGAGKLAKFKEGSLLDNLTAIPDMRVPLMDWASFSGLAKELKAISPKFSGWGDNVKDFVRSEMERYAVAGESGQVANPALLLTQPFIPLTPSKVIIGSRFVKPKVIEKVSNVERIIVEEAPKVPDKIIVEMDEIKKSYDVLKAQEAVNIGDAVKYIKQQKGYADDILAQYKKELQEIVRAENEIIRLEIAKTELQEALRLADVNNPALVKRLSRQIAKDKGIDETLWSTFTNDAKSQISNMYHRLKEEIAGINNEIIKMRKAVNIIRIKSPKILETEITNLEEFIDNLPEKEAKMLGEVEGIYEKRMVDLIKRNNKIAGEVEKELKATQENIEAIKETEKADYYVDYRMLPPSAVAQQLKALKGSFFSRAGKTIERLGAGGKDIIRRANLLEMDYAFEAGQASHKIKRAFRQISSSPTARHNFIGKREGWNKAPMSSGEKRANDIITAEMEKLRNIASERGLTIKNPRTGEEISYFDADLNSAAYYPHYIYPHILDNEATLQDKLTKALMREGVEEAQAVRQAQRIIDNMSQTKYGHLETARVVKLRPDEYITNDPLGVLLNYIDNSYYRLNQIKYFGKDNALITPQLNAITKNYGKTMRDFTDIALRRLFGTEKSGLLASAVRGIQSYNIVTKLGLAQLSNLTQSTNTIARFGAKRWGEAVAEYLKNPSKAIEEVKAMGGIMDDMTKTMAQLYSGGETLPAIASASLKWTGFTGVEVYINRILASVTGKHYAIDMFSRLMKNKADKFAIRELEKLGLSPKTLLEQGMLMPKDISTGMQSVVKRTQFKGGVLDLPLAWTSPTLKLLFQFKSFAYNQLIFVNDEILGSALKGNLMPLVRYAPLTLAGGTGVMMIRDWISNILSGSAPERKEWEGELPDRISYLLQVSSFAGGIGIASDMWRQVIEKGRTLQWIGGPIAGLTEEALRPIGKFGEGYEEGLNSVMALALQQIPAIGYGLRYRFFPKEKKKGKQSEFLKTAK